jgi:hypothetical protein
MERERTNQKKRIVDLLDFTDNGWLGAKPMSGRYGKRSPAYLHLKGEVGVELVRCLGLAQGFSSRGFGDHRYHDPTSLRMVEVSDSMVNSVEFISLCAFSMRLVL